MASILEPPARQTFTRVELERLLEWYRALPVCHDVVPRDHDLAEKIALELAKLRAQASAR